MSKKKLDSLIKEAVACYRLEEYGRELELWQEIHEIDPENPHWEHNIALALMNNNRYFEALKLFEKLAEDHPKLSRVHNNRAALLMRMGVDLQYLTPVLIQAVGTSEDMPVLCRHFVNLCGCIAYGFDQKREEVFDAIEDILIVRLKEVSPSDLLEKNKQFCLGMASAYRNIAAYREAFAEQKWRIAEVELDTAKTRLMEVGLDNFARGLESVMGYFTLCRDVVEIVERLGEGSELTPRNALKRCEQLLSQAVSLKEKSEGSFQERILNVLGWFLRGTLEALSFLDNPLGQYAADDGAQSMISKLTGNSFVALGSKLTSFLQFVDRQCAMLVHKSERIAHQESIWALRDEAWTRISLYCNGLAFDFREVDIALAREMLKWKQDPLENAKLESHGFKLFIERQAHKDIFVNGKPQENIARALLQAYLKARSYREVPVRGGQTDILVFTKSGRFLYETKIWRGPNYFQQGLKELEEYISGEGDDRNLSGVFYVLFDPTQSHRAQAYLQNSFSTEVVSGFNIEVVVINLILAKPSTKL